MKPSALVAGLALAMACASLTACSSGSSDSSSSDKTTGTTPTSPSPGKLQREKGKGDIKNVIVKTSNGSKISLAAAAPGHAVVQQTFNPTSKSWSAQTTVYKDDARFCHAIKLKKRNSTIAATVVCGISAHDTKGTQASYVLGTTDGKTWKRMDLEGASGKPKLSPLGNFVAWSGSKSFLLWNPKGDFTTVKYTQSPDAPAVGAMQNNGELVIVKAVPGKHKTCTISFQTASARNPAPHSAGATMPQADRARCVAVSAKMQGSDLIANFNSSASSTDSSGKKTVKTTPFSLEFTKLPNGNWAIKSGS